MWDFLKILFFNSLTILTPKPIDIGTTWVDIPLEKPVEAWNFRAALRLDISSTIDPAKGLDFKYAESLFPSGCVQGRLSDEKNQTSILLSSNGFGFSKSQTLIMLFGANIPIDEPFEKLSVRADCPISATVISWQSADF